MKYQVILADPPWHYNNRKTGGERCNKTKFGGGAMKHYPLMRDSELVAFGRNMVLIADENCALFMWATDPRKDFAIDLLRAWGFEYKTAPIHWIKMKKDMSSPIYGPGFYFASNHEEVLLGIKGSMQPWTKMQPSVIIAPRQKRHSEKPNIYRKIERAYPRAKKIELFARTKRPGWAAWGNQVNCDVDIPIGEEFKQIKLLV